jgi:hypothetical protein
MGGEFLRRWLGFRGCSKQRQSNAQNGGLLEKALESIGMTLMKIFLCEVSLPPNRLQSKMRVANGAPTCGK